MQLPAYPSNTYHQLSRAPSTGGRMTRSPCIPACLATVVPFTLWPAVMAAWRDEKNHVTRADTVALTSCCSLPFQTQLTRREWRQGAAWATRVSTIIQNRSRVLFFTTTKSLFSLMTYLHVFFKAARSCISFNGCFHFPLQWCRILQLYFCFYK